MAEATKKKKRGMLSSFTIILILLAIVAIITVAVAGTTDEVTAATLANFLTAPILGFQDAISVCLFVMILGGFLAMMTKTGALDNGIAALVQKLKGRESIMIVVLMLIFSLGGTTYGMCEETVPFYALLAATMMAAGMDAMVGAAVVLLGAGCGCLGSTVNPFAVGAAVDALSGETVGIEVDQSITIGVGAILWIVSTAIAIVFVVRYANKVKADKGSTILSLQEQEATMKAHGAAAAEATKEIVLTGRQKAVLWIFGFTFVVMIFGFIPWWGLNEGLYNGMSWSSFLTGVQLGDWYFDDASTWFFIMAIIIGIVGGLSEKEIVNTFISGAADMMSVVLIIALSRGVSVLMSETGFSEYLLKAAAKGLQGLPAIAFAPLSYLLYFGLSFLIPSTSGMATVSMPIMGPLAVKLGFSPEVMVMIFSAAIGVVNLFTPTSGAIMGGLALARIEWTTWLKFAMKIIVCIALASLVIVTVACMVIVP